MGNYYTGDDNELFTMMKQNLFPAVVGDVMDKMGFLHQFLPPRINPLNSDMVVIGRAMPVLEADCFSEQAQFSQNPLMSKPFGLMLEALDSLQENEVYICTGASARYALWGELMSARAMKQKAAGAIVDGYSRDTRGILNLGFPTFSYGGYAQDQGPRGKVIAYRIPIEMQGVTINPGDILFGDLDGICVIPKEREKEIIAAALEKVSAEKVVANEIENGMAASMAFEKYGVM